MNKLETSRIKKLRSQSGMSLVTVMLVGIVSTLWLTALYATVLPTYRRATMGRSQTALRSSAETALDWAVQQLTAGGSTLDCATYGASTTSTVPANILGSYAGMQITATVKVANMQPPGTSPGTSYLYDQALSYTPGNTSNGITSNLWRIVTATANIQDLGTSRSVRVVLKPSVTASTTTTYQTSTQTVDWPLPGGIAAKSTIKISGNGLTNGYNSSTNANPSSYSNSTGSIVTNGSLILDGNAHVGGNIIIASAPQGSTTPVIHGPPSSGNPYPSVGSNVIAYGNVTTNGTVSGNLSMPTPGTVKTTQQSTAQYTIPPVSSHPSTATQIAPLNVTGNNTYTFTQPGDYYIIGTNNGINVSGNGKIVLPNNTSTPVRIWVEGSSPSISIAGNGFANQSQLPKNLQIFYAGTSPISISGNGSFKGLLFAPGSDVSFSGNAGFYGALVANTVQISGNGQFHYDTVLGSINNLITTLATTTTQVTSTTQSVNNWQTVSWQEL